jgi:hypothetical protein
VFEVRLVGLLVEDSMGKPEASSEGEKRKEWMRDRGRRERERELSAHQPTELG